MYDELIKSLRDMSKMGTKYGMAVVKMHEAADAIEELQAAKCPHYIRNIHDRGDDSLCEKWGCEVKEVHPVRHGRWMYETETEMFQCSVCGGMAVRNEYPYCHWCGAKMDKEVSE